MKKLPLLILWAILVAACGTRRSSYADLQDDSIIDVEELEFIAKSVGKVNASEKKRGRVFNYDEVFNDSNYVQYASAEKLGINPMRSLSDAYNTSRPIVKIESCEFYQVDSLTHSMPFLVPEAADLLKEIGKSFCDKTEEKYGTRDNRILVTSVLRSPYSVKKLRRVNRNAVDSSTHMFATTFDLSYNSFYFTDSMQAVNPGVLKEILAEVLFDKRAEGKCLVKYERKSPCFHITVAR